MTTINENIRKYRLKSGMSQKELAERLNISPKTVSKWETCAGMPDVCQIVPLAQAFGISTDELLLPVHMDPYVPTEEYAFPRVVEYGVSFQTIALSAHTDVETVRETVVSGEFSKHLSDRPLVQTLGSILVFLDSLIPRFLADAQGFHMLTAQLYQELRDSNGVSGATIDKYAGLEEGTLDAYLMQGVESPPSKMLRLVTALFLLYNTLNKDAPFPWE